MVQVASSIEDHLFYARREGALADHLANHGRAGASGPPGIEGSLGSASRGQGAAAAVIDHLGVDVPQAAVDAEPGSRPGTGDSGTHPLVPVVARSTSFNL